MDDYHSILDESRRSDEALEVSGSEGSPVAHDDTTVVDNNGNATASDSESGNDGAMTVAAGRDNNQGFKVYAGYGGGGDEDPMTFMGAVPNSSNTNGSKASRAAAAPGAVQSSSAAWRTTAATAIGVSSSSNRTAVWLPRVVGECGRVHDLDTTDWGPGRGWNVSTVPLFRSPASPCNRLFSAIKETRPGREPKALWDRLAYYTQQPSPPRNPLPAHVLHSWDPSTSVTPRHKHRRKHHSSSSSSSETSSVNEDSSPTRRKLQPHQNVGHAASAPSKKAGRAGKGSHGQQQQHLGTKRSNVVRAWNISTLPEWKPTSKPNMFENIQDRKRSPRRVHNQYSGVKAQYRKPSEKYLRLRKERQLEAQRREDYLSLDMKYYSSSHDKRSR